MSPTIRCGYNNNNNNIHRSNNNKNRNTNNNINNNNNYYNNNNININNNNNNNHINNTNSTKRRKRKTKSRIQNRISNTQTINNNSNNNRTPTKQRQKQNKQSTDSNLKINLNELGYESDDSIIDDLTNIPKLHKEEEKQVNLEENIHDDDKINKEKGKQPIGIGNNKRSINRRSLLYDRATSSWYDRNGKEQLHLGPFLPKFFDK